MYMIRFGVKTFSSYSYVLVSSCDTLWSLNVICAKFDHFLSHKNHTKPVKRMLRGIYFIDSERNLILVSNDTMTVTRHFRNKKEKKERNRKKKSLGSGDMAQKKRVGR